MTIIWVPLGYTQKAQYVKHIKLSTLRRSHFDFLEIRQHLLLTKIIIIKKSASPSSFWKYLPCCSISSYEKILSIVKRNTCFLVGGQFTNHKKTFILPIVNICFKLLIFEILENSNESVKKFNPEYPFMKQIHCSYNLYDHHPQQLLLPLFLVEDRLHFESFPDSNFPTWTWCRW